MSFFVQAHQDDWQVHMGSFVDPAGIQGAFEDLRSGGKVVLIFTTAGDAGKAENWWKAREEGARLSVEFGVVGVGKSSLAWKKTIEKYNGHAIERCEFGKAVCIFMRLPDGGAGQGFPPRNESLEQCRNSNQILHAVDGSEAYQSWSDVTNTLRAILEIESLNQGNTIWINAIGPGPLSGHSDHENTAYAVSAAAQAAKALLGTRRQVQEIAFFSGSGRQPAKIPAPDAGAQNRVALFLPYDLVMLKKFDGAGTTLAEVPGYLGAWLAQQDPPVRSTV
jgi:LmbE family N-acetylglucosaminyl deacetylase